MISLVLGGARSGKSTYAEQLSRSLSKPQAGHLYYLATAQALDSEMTRRIKHHQKQRDDDWILKEVPINIFSFLEGLDHNDVVLVDCLTLWLTNVIMSLGDSVTGEPADQLIQQQVEKLLTALQSSRADIVLVSNEVGLGVMPLGEITRQFVDHAGWMNQAIAKIAQKVVLVTAGLPLTLKEVG
ncbi:bifunctional adenosylcobinamide kinase/adenosylcobinamide-phosphate guanylyltransferase [Vibrio sp. FNV 38]|nr:bifunctional adenosylcobinamide kinase/adenosylcobinamide-phosphate guanylyltransferase [Vibrio sp. FNV 38]